MRVDLTGRHVDISPGLRRLVDRKLQKVQRKVNDAAVSATVVVTKENINNVAELSLHARGERFLHAVAKATSWETAFTDVVAKVLHQVEKMKGVWHERKRRGTASRSVKTPVTAAGAAAPTPAIGPNRKVVRATRYSAKPMTVDEAAMALEGQQVPVLVFRDARTDAVSVLYRRDDGQIALIEPEA
jgi:putative sigma-54 modulation protein